jgi:hypothetical protein
MANKEKMQFKIDFLEATVNLYKEIGEPVPYGIITEIKYDRKVINTGLDELLYANKLVIIVNPYGTDEDFIGLYGKQYPKNMEELTTFRKNVKTIGVTEARKLLISG